MDVHALKPAAGPREQGTPQGRFQGTPETAAGAGGALHLDVRGLEKCFADVPVLRDIDFAVAQGEAVALIGANGCGKSTLLRCCLRLIEPSAGTLALLGRDITALPRRQLRRVHRQVGMVFQRHNLVPRLSALSNVLHGVQSRRSGPRTWLQSLAPADARAEAMACLERVGLADLAGRRVDQLSGGQSQRVAIARMLMQRPRLVFADEPVASLDPSAAHEVMELFAQLMRDEAITLVFTSHHLVHALDYADRIVGLKGGRLALDRASAGCRVEDLGHLYE